MGSSGTRRDQQACAALTHGRQHGAIDALHSEHVDVEQPLNVSGRVGLFQAQHAHPGVVDDDVDLPEGGRNVDAPVSVATRRRSRGVSRA
jgi:hypothetical protein